MTEFPRSNEKGAWRAWAKERRAALPLDDIAPAILSRLAALPEWQSAQNILLYLSFRGELPVEQTATDTSKNFYLPRCAPRHQLFLHRYIPGETPLVFGPHGLREPDPTLPAVSVGTIDLVVVPALLFSETGMRLGYGGGYYDRFLKTVRPDCIAVGAVLDALLVPELPAEPHDIPVSIVVTQTRILRPADTIEPTRPPC